MKSYHILILFMCVKPLPETYFGVNLPLERQIIPWYTSLPTRPFLEPMVAEVKITIYAKSRPFSLLSAIFTKTYEEKSSLLMNVTFLYTH